MSSLLVAGSRTIEDPHLVDTAIQEALLMWDHPPGLEITLVIHGGAKGVDREAGLIAAYQGLDVLVFPAQWEKYGRKAGYLRNVKMVQACDYAVVVWDSTSKGTGHTIDLLKKLGKPFLLKEQL